MRVKIAGKVAAIDTEPRKAKQTMIPSFLTDATIPVSQADACLPCFLDDAYHVGPDDSADWWLDLGNVCLPSR
jgi:hypothetical protein